MSGFPIQPSKVQRPPLRDDVLSRPRLNDQLEAKSAHRVVLLVAEAGYGKTTLLADWTCRTSRRVAWYRLDSDDRDWLTFLHHLVAAVRAVDDRFGSEVVAQLGSLGPGGPTRDQIVTTLAREISAVATDGLTVVLDDYHTVDDKEEVRDVLRALVERVADGVSFLISTRVEPELPLSRFRARAEVADLGAQDLRFDEAETERLFREAYQRPLEPDVLIDLAARTEGWAASLQLVRTAIRERTQSEIRAFVRKLSGAGGDLYDYLAEEVVGRLSDDLQQFLMRASLLESVMPEAMQVVFDDDPRRIDALLERSEALGLLSRRGDDDSPHRFHPLVREFLLARVNADLGEDAVRELHRKLGSTFEGRDWRLSATHYAAAAEADKVWEVINASLDQILARGEYLAAATLLRPYAAHRPTATTLVVTSRLELQRGSLERARASALQAVQVAREQDETFLASVLLNASGIHYLTFDKVTARRLAEDAGRLATDPSQRQLAEASLLLQSVAADGSMHALLKLLYEMRSDQQSRRAWHHLGITELNIAMMEVWMERPEAALAHGETARDLLQDSARDLEAAAADLARAMALGQLGQPHESDQLLRSAATSANRAARVEVLVEAAKTCLWYGPSERARSYMLELDRIQDRGFYATIEQAIRVWVAIEEGDPGQIARELNTLLGSPLRASCEGELFTVQLAVARAAWRLGREDSAEHLAALGSTAGAQESVLQINVANLLNACAEGALAVSDALVERPTSVAATILATDVLLYLDGLSHDAVQIVARQAERSREKWMPAIRRMLVSSELAPPRAIQIVQDLGDATDVNLLRTLGKRSRRNSVALVASRRLAQRTASKLFIQDMGRVRLAIDGVELIGVSVRRKVLSILCLLVIHPQMTATRDQVLDAIWPDLDPSTALNSLNQTIYFLRRVINPHYVASMSPEYIHFEGEAIWLDRDLVSSASQACRDLINRSQGRESEVISEVLATYSARFALDFVYEDWAATYRDSLHAAYLSAVERAIVQLELVGRVEEAIAVARRCLEVDPTADQVELRLLRLYRRTGAHAAAGEQYAHYAAMLRDELGVEPPDLGEI